MGIGTGAGMGIFGRRDEESMDPEELLARGYADMAESSAVPSELDDATGGFRMTVADVFVIQRRGTVVTGVVETGAVAVGSAVRIERGGQVIAQTVINGIEKFRDRADTAQVGENVGLLVEALDGGAVQSGDVLVS